jgi:creatinine amidohydrolase
LLQKEFDEEKFEKLVEMLGTDKMGAHAGNLETSSMMAIDESLVKMDRVEDAGLVPNYGRTKHLGSVYTSIYWYAAHPTHQAGEPFKANKEVGEFSRELSAKVLAEQVKVIKDDITTLDIQNEFFEKAENPLGKYPDVPKPKSD